MGLPWIRLDTAYPRNPKVLAMITERDGYRAAFADIASFCYAGEQGSDGFIPAGALPFIHARPKEVELLVRHRLWVPARNGGWTVNGWAEFQRSDAETQERARQLQIASKKGNCVRWHGPDCGCWESDD